MKIIITLALALFLNPVNAQTPYEVGMIKGMELMKTDLSQAAAQFERIASVETTNWLPAYYVSLCHINNSWGQNPKDKTIAHLEVAQEYLDKATALSKENAELLVLQALINTCYVVMDSATYGMKLSGPTTAVYKKAYAIAPQNPRVISNQASWNMGTAKYFNKDVTPYCNDFKTAITLFNAENPTNFMPSWGLKNALESQKSCSK